MRSLQNVQSAYLVGIKGVGMTSLAQCLLDAGIKVAGADVAEEFITQPLLDKLKVKIDIGFEHQLADSYDLVVYSSAHQGSLNPLVEQAEKNGIDTLTLAEALSMLFNQQKGIAVCGVGGKSTTSALISFILTQLNLRPSFSVGVGKIIGMDKTGAFNPNSQYFIAEADEYAANPELVKLDYPLVPRFKYLEPKIIICTNLKFDHPDVYQDFEQTKAVFGRFFQQLKKGGALIINSDDQALVDLAYKTMISRPDLKLIGFGEKEETDFQLIEYQPQGSHALGKVKVDEKILEIKTQIPGKYNIFNALAALAVSHHLELPIDQVVKAIATFRSTQRRMERLGEVNGVIHFDDYAHHPSQLIKTYRALSEWFDPNKILFAFQPHTFSRTKALFDQFVEALAPIDHLVLLAIFPSAREAKDDTISSLKLAQAITQRFPQKTVYVASDLAELAEIYRKIVKAGWVFITVGAGDIYQVHNIIFGKNHE